MPALNVSAGGGSLDKARGRFKLKFNGVALTGEQDILGNPVDTSGLAAEESTSTPDVLDGATWANGSWTGPVAGGATWTGATWAGATWAGATWAGATWAGATWADAQWANDLWSSAGWE